MAVCLFGYYFSDRYFDFAENCLISVGRIAVASICPKYKAAELDEFFD